METLCQSLDSVESALLSVTGDGLSVDGHCNKSDCRELDCDLILSITGVSQLLHTVYVYLLLSLPLRWAWQLFLSIPPFISDPGNLYLLLDLL